MLIAGLVAPAATARAQQAAGPQEVVRGFCAWYLHQLSRENVEPLKQKTTALKFLTPRLNANEAEGNVREIKFLNVGQPAPQFECTTINGDRVSSAGFKGKILVLKFWGTY